MASTRCASAAITAETHNDRLLTAGYVAVMQFGKMRIDALGRTMIWRLRRFPVSGIWGDDYIYRTLWDEFCHEVQEGNFDAKTDDFLPSLSSAFEMTIRPFIDSVLERLPYQEAVLLTLYAASNLSDAQQAELAGSTCLDAVSSKVMEMLCEEAAGRDLFPLGPHRDG